MSAEIHKAPADKLLSALDAMPDPIEHYPPRDVERIALDEVEARLRELGVDTSMPAFLDALVAGAARDPAERLLSVLNDAGIEGEAGEPSPGIEEQPLEEVKAKLNGLGVGYAAEIERIRKLLNDNRGSVPALPVPVTSRPPLPARPSVPAAAEAVAHAPTPSASTPLATAQLPSETAHLGAPPSAGVVDLASCKGASGRGGGSCAQRRHWRAAAAAAVLITVCGLGGMGGVFQEDEVSHMRAAQLAAAAAREAALAPAPAPERWRELAERSGAAASEAELAAAAAREAALAPAPAPERWRELAVEMAPPGGAGPPAEVATGMARAEPGARPAGAVGQRVRARVRIQEVDPVTGRVAFVGPQGVRRVVTPQNAAMADFARRLRPGDEVDMTYAKAVAVRVEPADR